MTILTPAIAYFRVSTTKQEGSGLGLEAQQASVRGFAAARGYQVLQEFTEVETGTGKKDRPQLHAALKLARERGAVLLIAKLDRLARNVKFIADLLESKVKFVAVDMPEVDNLTIHILAAVAEKEARLISTRTRDALAAAKARGQVLGKPENLTPEAQQKSVAVNRQKAVQAYQQQLTYIRMLREQGKSLQQIADQLNQDGYRTRQGATFTKTTIQRILQRTGGIAI